MNDPVNPRQAALAKREARARRVRRIRGGVATLGAALAIAFSTVVMQRQSETTADAQVASTAVNTAQATTATLPESQSLGSTGSESSDTATYPSTVTQSTTVPQTTQTVPAQSAPLTTSQS